MYDRTATWNDLRLNKEFENICGLVIDQEKEECLIVTEEKTDSHSQMRMTEYAHWVIHYDLKVKKSISSTCFNQKTGPGAGTGSDVYSYIRYEPFYDENKKQLYLLVSKRCYDRNTDKLKKKEDKKIYY